MEQQPTEEQQNSFFEVGREMWERASKVYELVDNYYENKSDDNKDEGLKELKDLTAEIKELKEESSKLIQKSIGYMYNGVLVSGDISCRKGKVYRFRCQYKLGNSTIKKSIMRNLQEVEKKLTSVNLGILETLLEFVDENDNDYGYNSRNNFGYNSRNNDNEKTEVEFPQIRVAEFDKENGVSFRQICKIKLSDEGDINFHNEEDRRCRLEKYTRYMLKAKLKKELQELSKGFIEKQTERRNQLVEQVTTIKSKALNLLMLAEIDKQTDTNE